MIDYQTLRKTVQDAATRKHESTPISTDKALQACASHVLSTVQRADES